MTVFISKKNLHHQAGFTLIEIMVAVFVFTLIVYGLVALLSHLFTVSSGKGRLLSDQDQARKLAAQIATEVRNAVPGSNGAYNIDTAGDQQLIFYSANSDTDAGIERVRYFVQNGSLYKGVTEFNGTTYDTTKEKTYVVQSDLAAGSAPVFLYYGGDYAGINGQNPLTQPVNPTQVKFVKISLPIYIKAGVTNTNTFTVTEGSSIRNLKTNLGEGSSTTTLTNLFDDGNHTGDFETGVDGFLNYDGGTIARITTDSKTGSAALQASVTWYYVYGNYGGGYSTFPTSLSVGTTYTFSFWAKAPSGNPSIQWSIQNGSGDTNCLSSTVDHQLTSTWQKFVQTCALDINKNKLFIYTASSPGSTFYIDDIQLVQGSTAGP